MLDLTEDEKEKRARDARRRERERERRHRENKEKKPTNRKLDIIDQLDATSIYGTGSELSPNPCLLFSANRHHQQCSITMARSMLSTPTGTRSQVDPLLWKPSLKAR